MHLAGEEREGVIRLSSALARVRQASTANDVDGVVMSGEQLSLNSDDWNMAVVSENIVELARKMRLNFRAKKINREGRVVLFISGLCEY